MCLGVAQRGGKDEDDWFGEREEFFESYEDLDEELEDTEEEDTEYQSLLYWLGKQLMTTRCSNEGAVIKWTLVPFIVEEEEEEEEEESAEEESNDSSSENIADVEVESDDEEL